MRNSILCNFKFITRCFFQNFLQQYNLDIKTVFMKHMFHIVKVRGTSCSRFIILHDGMSVFSFHSERNNNIA